MLIRGVNGGSMGTPALGEQTTKRNAPYRYPPPTKRLIRRPLLTRGRGWGVYKNPDEGAKIGLSPLFFHTKILLYKPWNWVLVWRVKL